MKKHKIIVLDGEKLLRKNSVKRDEEKDVTHVDYRIDYTNEADISYFGKNTEESSEPVFQEIVDMGDLVENNRFDEEDGLQDIVIFIDTDRFAKKKNEKIKLSEDDLSKLEDLENRELDDFRFQELCERGIKIKFNKEQDYCTYFPYDYRGNTLSKNRKVFVRNDIGRYLYDSNRSRFDIIVYNGKQLLKDGIVESIDDKAHVTYRIDYTKEDRDILKEKVEETQNPLFREIANLKELRKDIWPAYKNGLVDLVFYVDTTGFDQTKGISSITESDSSDTTDSKSQNSEGFKIQELYNNGIKIKYTEEQAYQTFLPYKCSGITLPRNRKMFIRKDICELLDRTLYEKVENRENVEIVVLDGERLLQKNIVQESKNEENTDGNCHVYYQIDYENAYDRRYFTKCTEVLGVNALFHQILDITGNRLSSGKWDKKALKDKIIYVDLDEFFSKDHSKDKEIDIPTKNHIDELKNTSKHDYDEYRIKEILKNGIEIKFDDAQGYMKFVPFDKSNSMAKRSTISFIREDLKKALDERLNLGIDFSKIQVSLSKYYAYRGLYLTDSSRVDPNALILNEKSVVVVKDESYIFHGNAKKAYQGEMNENNNEVTFKDDEIEKIEKIYDGEGLISPEAKNIINQCLGFDNATSFQIRLPFAKGMLHSVDFHKFLKEYGNMNDGDERFLIIDAYGFQRDLMKAQMILPESMFKCVKWLKDLENNLNNKDKEEYLGEKLVGDEQYKCFDPMKYYFSKIKEYDHALYISNTNLSYGRSAKIKLGYQFLSTLGFSEEELKKYIDENIKYANDPIEYLRKTQNSQDVKEDTDTDECIHNTSPLWVKALLKNPDLANEPKIRNELRNISFNIKQELAYGRFLVDGEVRLLSRDLLGFLIYLLKLNDFNNLYMEMIESSHIKDDKNTLFDWLRNEQNDNSDNVLFKIYLNKNVTMLENARMFQDCFYMPNSLTKLKAKKYYSFWRNPHLSRLEQCAMTPYMFRNLNKETGDIYKKYFNDLHGIVMVSYNSMVPDALGGADFDGDIVKIIFDETINEKVLKNNYCDKGVFKGRTDNTIQYEKSINADGEIDRKQFNKRTIYRRDEPIIKIVSPTPSKENVPEVIPYELIKDTFSNKVGQISNKAVEIAKHQYGSFDYHGPRCEQCTVLTGLEIDAAKNGRHPDLSDLEDESISNKAGDKDALVPSSSYIHGFMNPYKKNFTGPHNYKISKTNIEYDSDGYKVKKSKNDEEPVIFYKADDPSYALGVLPERFFDLIRDKIDDTKKNTQGNKKNWFKRSSGIDWDKCITENKDIVSKVMAVELAYNRVLELNRELNKWTYSRDNRTSFAGHVYNILAWQYDINGFSKNWTTLNDLIVKMAATKQDDETKVTLDSVDQSIKSYKELQWPLTLKDNRKEVLEQIIDISMLDASERDDFEALMTNFDEQGYMLLRYFLYDLKALIKDQISDKEYLESISSSEDNNKPESLRKSSIQPDERTYHEVYNKLYNEFYEMVDQDDTGIMNNMYAIAAEIIDSIFSEYRTSTIECAEKALDESEGNNPNDLQAPIQEDSELDSEFKLLVMYYLRGKADKNSEFFWKYFNEDMLKFVEEKTS